MSLTLSRMLTLSDKNDGCHIPFGMEVREGGDKGIPVVVSFPDSPQSKAVDDVAEEVARQIPIEAMKPELTILTRANR